MAGARAMTLRTSILRIRKHVGSTATTAQSPTTTSDGRPSKEVAVQQRLDIPKADIKRSTKLRRGFVIAAAVCHVLSWIFFVLVLVGNTHNKPVLDQIYLYKLELADIIPTSVPNANLINSIAQTIGLHDFYQVGLWNFCEGYNNVGITTCSAPQNLYWFNPVEVLMDELLAGATIALPSQVITILTILRISSQLMFGFFLTSTVFSFILAFASHLALFSHWWSLPLSFFAGLASMMATSASIVGSVISFVFKYAAESQSELNIHAEVGKNMFIFMWLASAFALIAFLIHAGMGCCCTSVRDLRTGRRQVSEQQLRQASEQQLPQVSEQPPPPATAASATASEK